MITAVVIVVCLVSYLVAVFLALSIWFWKTPSIHAPRPRPVRRRSCQLCKELENLLTDRRLRNISRKLVRAMSGPCLTHMPHDLVSPSFRVHSPTVCLPLSPSSSLSPIPCWRALASSLLRIFSISTRDRPPAYRVFAASHKDNSWEWREGYLEFRVYIRVECPRPHRVIR